MDPDPVDPGPSNDACNTLRNLQCRSGPSDDIVADLKTWGNLKCSVPDP